MNNLESKIKNLKSLKTDFPIFSHHPDLVYLDTAASAQKPQVVIDAVANFYAKGYSNVHRGLYPLSEQASNSYESARQIFANFIGAEASEVVFTSGLTGAINDLARAIEDKFFTGDQLETILLTDMEHHSNIIPWQQLAKRTGASLSYATVTDEYRLNLKDLHAKVKGHNVKVLALTHVSNTLGTVNNIEEIVTFMRKNSPQTLIVLDASQSAPHMQLNVKTLDVDFAAFAGHKLYGPTGIGVLYGKNYLLKAIDPLQTGGGMIDKVERQDSTWASTPSRHEAGTPNIAGAIGLAAAIDYLNNIGMGAIEAHEAELTAFALEKLKQIDKLKVLGPVSTKKRSGVISFSLDNIHPHDIAASLAERHIAIRAGHHCTQILHREHLQLPATARASFGLYNSVADVDVLVAGVKECIEYFAK